MSIITQKATILGVKKFQGTVDGKQYDTCTVYMMTDTDVESGNALGYASNEMRFGDSSNFDMFRGKRFPLEVETDTVITTNGKTVKLQLKAVRIIQK